jgi:16S rRNA (uracil1498-N3)-methyltransferase
MPRFHCPVPLALDTSLALPAGAARHVQVLRLQPGDAITLFNGEGGEYTAVIERMGRQDVDVRIDSHQALEREAPREVHIAMGMPANERMDWLIEKATELGVASIQPLLTERSVLRLSGERAEKKQAHWQSIAAAACEQCGRNRVPTVHAPRTLADWLGGPAPASAPERPTLRWMLSLTPDSLRLPQALTTWTPSAPLFVLSGPEGGLSASEENTARAHGFAPISLGASILRAETAPLSVLACMQLA